MNDSWSMRLFVKYMKLLVGHSIDINDRTNVCSFVSVSLCFIKLNEVLNRLVIDSVLSG